MKPKIILSEIISRVGNNKHRKPELDGFNIVKINIVHHATIITGECIYIYKQVIHCNSFTIFEMKANSRNKI